jgi:hypothetical protein
MWNFVHAEKLSLEKIVVANERDRPDVARRRGQWKLYQRRIDPQRLVFIDETWSRTNMAPLRGWAPRGQRLLARVPHGKWTTMTFLAALRHDRVEAPWLLDGPINGQKFQTYVEKVLVPRPKTTLSTARGTLWLFQSSNSCPGRFRQACLRWKLTPVPCSDQKIPCCPEIFPCYEF